MPHPFPLVISFWSLSAKPAHPFQRVSCSPVPSHRNCFWESHNSLACGEAKNKYFSLFSNACCSLHSLRLQFIPRFTYTNWPVLDSSFLLGFCTLLPWQSHTQININIVLPLLLWLTQFCVFLSPTAGLTSLILALLVVIQPLPDTIPPHTVGRHEESFSPVVEPAALSTPFCGGGRLKYATGLHVLTPLLLPTYILFPFPGFHSSSPTDGTPVSPCLHASYHEVFWNVLLESKPKAAALSIRMDLPIVQYPIKKDPKTLPHH